VEAPDDSTLTLNFSAPQSLFPLVLCVLPVLPRHILEGVPIDSMRAAPFSFNPVGNGPFRFVSRNAGRRWVFEHNDDFPIELGGPPHIRRLIIAVVDEATTKFAGLVSGELDVAGISPTMAALASQDPRLRVLSYPLMLANGLVFNVHRAPFDDVRVRRAISLSIDRARLVDVALAGYGLPGTTAVVPDNPLSLAGVALRDTALADSLLDSAGWKRDRVDGLRRRDGRELEFELMTVVTANNEMEQLIQSDLAARGIRMRIRGIEFASFLATARERPKRFDALVTGVPGDLSLAYLASMFDSRLAGGALDYADFHSARLDSLFVATRRADDPARLRDAWVAVQQELQRELPVAWLYHSRGVQGLSARLEGVTMDLRGELVTIVDWKTDALRVSSR
jgi:peptide/nickel transport system substrate-binding protein